MPSPAMVVLQPQGAGVRTVVERESQESATSAVEAGLGITFRPWFPVALDRGVGRLARATVAGLEPGRRFSAVRSAAHPPGRLGAAFLTIAETALGDSAALPESIRERPVRGSRGG